MDVSVRKAKIYTRRYVSAREIYELVRRYRISKNNPAFSRTIATVRACDDHEPKSHYLVMYRWAGEHLGPEDFVLSRHGNATRSITTIKIQSYSRKSMICYKRGCPRTECTTILQRKKNKL